MQSKPCCYALNALSLWSAFFARKQEVHLTYKGCSNTMSKSPTGCLLTLILLVWSVAGCDFSPPRDNPLDPASPGYRAPSDAGRLSIRVLTLAEEPLVQAVVTLRTTPLQVVETDSSGWARFNTVPSGELTVEASKSSGPGAIYSTVSRSVTITAGTHYETVIRLNALPDFISTTVNAITVEEITSEPPDYRLYLRAQVIDADGPSGLVVSWSWIDTVSNISQEGTLEWSPDSASYQKYLHSSEFTTGSITAALGGTFTYEVRDQSGIPVLSDPIRLVRVLHQVPYDLGSRRTNPPTIEWAYRYGEGRDFTNNSQFDYGVRVFRPLTPFPDLMVFDTLIVPPPPPQPITNTLKLPVALTPGMYYWYVWVSDKFGNSIRSHRESLLVEGIPAIGGEQ